jgi:hypothetical protein
LCFVLLTGLVNLIIRLATCKHQCWWYKCKYCEDNKTLLEQGSVGTMIVDGIFEGVKIGTIVTGHSNWQDNLTHKVGDVLTCETKQWTIIGVERIHQGCFGAPKDRYHALKLDPIGHDTMPAEGDILV